MSCSAALPVRRLLAQLPTDSPVDVLRHPGWNKGLFIGGGTSVASSPSGQSFLVGFRLGRVLTNEHGSGFLRGTFEMAGDIIPVDEYWIHGGQYAGGINPFIAKWNFTSPCKVAPYIAAVGGVLFSTHNLPAGRHLASQLHQRRRSGRADIPQGAKLLGPGGQGLSPFQRFARQSQSRHQCVPAIHAGIHVVLGSSGAPRSERRPNSAATLMPCAGSSSMPTISV